MHDSTIVLEFKVKIKKKKKKKPWCSGSDHYKEIFLLNIYGILIWLDIINEKKRHSWKAVKKTERLPRACIKYRRNNIKVREKKNVLVVIKCLGRDRKKLKKGQNYLVG